MFKVIKNKGKIVQAYQLGSDSTVLKELVACGKICDLGNDRYEIYSQEALNGTAGGEIAKKGDWVKIDGNGCPYPNDKVYFEENHRHIEGDFFEQMPKALYAWNADCEMCPEITFLVKEKGMKINEDSYDNYYTAPLWGTQEVANRDAVIVFYSISYGSGGNVTDVDFNFIGEDEFKRTYSRVR